MVTVPVKRTLAVGKAYYLCQESPLGKGSFGEVVEGIIPGTEEAVAIKRSRTATSLDHEAMVYRRLNAAGCAGIPQLLDTGTTEDGRTALVFQLYGPDLGSLVAYFRRFSLKNVVAIGKVLLNIIELVHDARYIHGDIKPANIVVSEPTDPMPIHLIDLGAAQEFLTPEGQHLPECVRAYPKGSVDFTSVRSETGLQQSRRDDLESIGYTLIYLAKGSLPWTSASEEDVPALKAQASHEELCQGVPRVLGDLVSYAKHLSFEDRPDYERLRMDLAHLAQSTV